MLLSTRTVAVVAAGGTRLKIEHAVFVTLESGTLTVHYEDEKNRLRLAVVGDVDLAAENRLHSVLLGLLDQLHGARERAAAAGEQAGSGLDVRRAGQRGPPRWGRAGDG